MIHRFFVYGTLKTQQCRETMWPSAAKSIVPAWVYGTLYDRYDYPAMSGGGDRVLGELWEFDTSVVANVLKRLDAIEGTHDNGPDDLYHRVII
ncbi:MAG: gamma-glutamylcyclotransferase, partial [Pirellulaceae bacterium]|nr:gamma-glutamylcyclotransferase [Pirellulaceae bacterium]